MILTAAGSANGLHIVGILPKWRKSDSEYDWSIFLTPIYNGAVISSTEASTKLVIQVNNVRWYPIRNVRTFDDNSLSDVPHSAYSHNIVTSILALSWDQRKTAPLIIWDKAWTSWRHQPSFSEGQSGDNNSDFSEVVPETPVMYQYQWRIYRANRLLVLSRSLD
jgi:hypothetical protein